MLHWDKLLYPKRARDSFSVTRTANDKRSPFMKDFDTVCNSSVLRRLQDKAQVFPLEQEDYARTRLTHSIEVMSVAGALAVHAVKIILETDFSTYASENGADLDSVRHSVQELPTILNAAALLHDMGNPPFGHLGEQIISDWFKANLSSIVRTTDNTFIFGNASRSEDTLAFMLKGKYFDDLTHFEGNAQLLRHVTKLSYVVDENGMNLSYPVLATLIKYPCPSTEIKKNVLSKKKMGYFTSEEKIFDDVTKTLGLNHCRHPLAFLLEAADDIAYLSADIEDAQQKGIVSLDYLISRLSERKDDAIVQRVLDEITRYKKEAVLINHPSSDGYAIRRTRILIKGLMIDAMYDSFKDLYPAIMSGICEEELIAHSKVAILADILRDIEREKIYYSKGILESKTRAFTIISKLLDVYVPAVLSYSESDSGKDTAANLLYLSLSKSYRFVCETQNNHAPDEHTKIYNKLLLITDQISGMTDSHAVTVYKTITAS